jgi:hypothetical protein
MEGSLVAYKVFTNGSVLNASEINTNLMNQSVMVFSNSTARAAALTAPTEGMLTWLEDVNRYEFRNGSGAWVTLGNSGVLQVVSTAKTDTFTTSSTTYTGITGLTAAITPSATTSKVLVTVQLAFSPGGNGAGVNYGSFRLTGGNTASYRGASASARRAAVYGGTSNTDNASAMHSNSIVYLDSPATTSATTYGVEVVTRSGGFVAINRSTQDGDDDFKTRGASSITVMEIAG